jgi:hypothetical protein
MDEKFELADQDIVDRYPRIVASVVQTVVGLDPDQVLVTDESTLRDFCMTLEHVDGKRQIRCDENKWESIKTRMLEIHGLTINRDTTMAEIVSRINVRSMIGLR